MGLKSSASGDQVGVAGQYDDGRRSLPAGERKATARAEGRRLSVLAPANAVPGAGVGAAFADARTPRAKRARKREEFVFAQGARTAFAGGGVVSNRERRVRCATKDMLEAAESMDAALPDMLQHGFPLVGVIPRVGLGAPLDAQPAISASELRSQRASLNAATMRRVASEQRVEHDQVFVSKAEEDVAAGRAAWVRLGLDRQLVIPRFPVDEGWKEVPGKPPKRKARARGARGTDRAWIMCVAGAND